MVFTPGVQPRPGMEHNVRIRGQAAIAAPVPIAGILSPSSIRATRKALRACLTTPRLRETAILSSLAGAAEMHLRHGEANWPAEARSSGPAETLCLDSPGFA